MKIGLLSHTVFALLLVAAAAMPTMPAEPEDVLCGDLDGDGALNVGDLIYYRDYFWEGGPAPVDMWAANYDGCEGINVCDMMVLLCRLFPCGPPGTCDTTLVCPSASLGAISLESVTPPSGLDRLFTGSTPRFSIRLTNNSIDEILALTFGFRIYSPDGAAWDTTVLSLTEAFPDSGQPRYSLDGGTWALGFGTDGAGADTVGVGAHAIFMEGMAVGFDSVAVVIDVGPITEESAGKTICLDSAFYPPGGEWLWDNSGYHDYATNHYYPTWDGPHCFTVESCCEHRGNLSLSGSINVSDLTYLIAHLFQGGPGAACFEIGDVNGDLSGPNISDLTYLVGFLFQGGAAPPGC